MDIKGLLSGALSDYSQLVNPQQNERYAATQSIVKDAWKNATNVNPRDPGSIIGQAALNELPLGHIIGGLAGTILKPKVFDEMMKHYGGPAGITKKIFYDENKTPKSVMIGDDAVNYYIDQIKHLKKFDKEVDGKPKTFYRNLDDLDNFYSGVWNKPDLVMNASYAGDTKGSGKFNDILTGIILNEGQTHPTSITRREIANLPTLESFADGIPFDQTFLGHSSKRIADNLGGLLGPLSISPGNQYNQDLIHAVKSGVNINDFNNIRSYYENLPSVMKPIRFADLFKNVDLTGKISYPGLLNRPQSR